MTFFCAPGGAWAHYTAAGCILGVLGKKLEWLWDFCLVRPKPYLIGSGVINGVSIETHLRMFTLHSVLNT